MKTVDYPLDLLSPVRHVATELDRAAGAALSIGEMAETYWHANPADLSRVQKMEGCANDYEAVRWLIGRAVEELRKNVVANGDGKVHLAEGKAIGTIRYKGKVVAALTNPHVRFGDPFDPMSGRFRDNIRRNSGKDTMDDLRDSMRALGWLEGHVAIRDERGVVLVGHRRLKVAEQLRAAGVDIEDRVIVVRLGDDDEATAKRLELAIGSNVGAKGFTPEERASIAEYLYNEREWSMERIGEALKVTPKTVSQDLRGFTGVKPPARGGRPRNLTDEQQATIIRVHLDEGQTQEAASQAAGLPPGRGSKSSVTKVIDQERGRREAMATPHPCPQCGHLCPGAAT